MGIMNNIHKTIIMTSQNNLLNIVSFYFAQEKYQKNKLNPFIMCQPDVEKKDKVVENYPLISYKYKENHLKYTKYEYRQIYALQMIMINPKIFICLTEDEILLWNENVKISAHYLEKYKNNQNVEINDKSLKKFDDDLFYLSYTIITKIENQKEQKNKKIKNISELQFVLFSSQKIIKEGKIVELFFINKINNVFPINNNKIFISIGSEIKIFDLKSKKIAKTDLNLKYLEFEISYAKHLFDDLILITSINDINKKNHNLNNNKNNKPNNNTNNQKMSINSIIYSVDKESIIYFIEDKITNAFNLGKNKVVLIGEKIKELLLLPDMYVLSLEEYETDIFNSLESKSFYPINDTTFLFINHKTKKLKEVIINEVNELIITKEILCPIDFISFNPFVYTYEKYTRLLCALFISKDQTYQILNHDLMNLFESDGEEVIFSSIKRLFLNFYDIDKEIINNNDKLSSNSTNQSFGNQIDDIDNIYIPYSIINSGSNSTLNFALCKNKKLYEINSFCNYFEPNMKLDIVYSSNSKDIYIIALIKNILIYIVKINNFESSDVNIKYNFGNIKSKGIISIGNDSVFLFFNKKALVINVKETFKSSKLIPLDNYLFDFNILYSYQHSSNILLLSSNKLHLFDINEKKIIKQMNINLEITLDENIENSYINILNVQENIYILIVDDKYILFNIEKFEKIKANEIKKIKYRTVLFFKSNKEYFEIIKKDIVIDKIIYNKIEKTDEQRHKMKYLSLNKLFIGVYPNKFYIFDNNENNST